MKKEEYIPTTTAIEWNPIKNIDPINGVTLIQLWNQLKYLAIKTPQSYMLSDVEISDAVTDVSMKVFNKMQSGNVDKFVYETFKNYLFISLKNELQHIINKRYNVSSGVTYTIELNDELKVPNFDENDSDILNEKMEIFKLAILKLSPADQQLVQQYFDKGNFYQVMRENNLHKSYTAKIKKEIIFQAKKIAHLQGLDHLFAKRLSPKEVEAKQQIKDENKATAKTYRKEQIEQRKKQAEERIKLSKAKRKGRPLGHNPKIDFVLYERILAENHKTKRELFLALLNNGFTMKQISKVTGSSRHLVTYYCVPGYREMHLDNMKKSRQKKTNKLKMITFSMFPRNQYYSQTELVKTFQISSKKLKEAIVANNIPVIKKDIDLGEYSVKGLYVLKTDIAKLNLKPRI